MSANFSSTHHFRISTGVVPDTNLFSFGCWFNPDGPAESQWIMSPHTSNGIIDVHGLVITVDDNLRIFVDSGGDNSSADTSNSTTDGVWHHASFVIASTTDRTLTLDGNFGAQAAVTDSRNVASSTAFWIGQGVHSTASNFDGQIFWAYVYDAALTQAEETMLALGFHPYQVRPDKLVFFAEILDGSGNELDTVGGLTLTNQTAVTHISDSPPVYYPTEQIIQFPSAATGTKSFTVNQTVFGQMGLPRLPFGSFAGKAAAGQSIVPHVLQQHTRH